MYDLSFREMMDHKDEEAPSMERLLSIFKRHLKRAVEVIAEGLNIHMAKQQYVTPELVMNLMMHNTIETGTDITVCAEIQTLCLDGAGLATVADSLAAIEQRVIKEKASDLGKSWIRF